MSIKNSLINFNWKVIILTLDKKILTNVNQDLCYTENKFNLYWLKNIQANLKWKITLIA